MTDSTKVRVFIGSGPRFERSTNALIASILAHTDPDAVDIRLMEAGAEPEWSNWKGQPTEQNFGRVPGNWVTPFSLFRYAIPACCGFTGYAIYLDTDMIVLDDIRLLWEMRRPGEWRTAPNRDGDCVTVMDCAAIEPHMHFDRLQSGAYGNKHQLRRRVEPVVHRTLPPEWNDTDRYRPGTSRLVHYTSMITQPWHPYPEVLDYEPHPDPGAVALWHTWDQKADQWQISSSTSP